MESVPSDMYVCCAAVSLLFPETWSTTMSCYAQPYLETSNQVKGSREQARSMQIRGDLISQFVQHNYIFMIYERRSLDYVYRNGYRI